MKKILIVLFILGAYIIAESQPSIDLTHQQAPTFYLPVYGGGNFFASEFYGEKVKNEHKIVFSFFASWCVACNDEIPILDSLSSKYKDVNFYLINFKENNEVITKWLEKIDVKIPILTDSYGLISKQFNVLNTDKDGNKSAILPSLFIINASGEIIYHHTGFNKEDVIQIVEKLK
ncbi:MAG: TlpA family protein disulfide reductase [Candidatus Marinimicrobia bacterium]|nr:TlpA family protein disulfide reductase [Candidatus Neomarinimicrobiota bacterium]